MTEIKDPFATSLNIQLGELPRSDNALPSNLLSFVLSFGKGHQLAMVTMSVAIFAFGTAPLEVQPRIVNASTTTGSFTTIALLVLVYLALTCSEGLIKVVFNL